MNALEPGEVAADKIRKIFQEILDHPDVSAERKARAKKGMKLINELMSAKRLELTRQRTWRK